MWLVVHFWQYSKCLEIKVLVKSIICQLYLALFLKCPVYFCAYSD